MQRFPNGAVGKSFFQKRVPSGAWSSSRATNPDGRVAGRRQNEVAEGWDDWGPFYSQTYGAFFGVDGSTVEMCNNAACGGDARVEARAVPHLLFSADFWIENRATILADQLEIFRRGVAGAARVSCCDDRLVAGRGVTEAQHN